MSPRSPGLQSQGIIDWKLADDGRLVCLVPQIFGARITRAERRDGFRGAPNFPQDEIEGYDEAWSYASMAEAWAAFHVWNGVGIPGGVIRKTYPES